MNSPCTQIRYTGTVVISGSGFVIHLPRLQYYLASLSWWWRERREQIEARRLITSYLALDDRMLEDIGLRRSDVLSALQLPLSICAAQELEAIKAQRLTRYRRNLS